MAPMADETSGRVTATLSAIRARAEGPMRKFGDVDASQADVPRLLAAVEAALKLHYPVYEDYLDGDGIERASRECAECEPPGTPDNWPCPTVQAITAALTGTQPGEGGSHG